RASVSGERGGRIVRGASVAGGPREGRHRLVRARPCAHPESEPCRAGPRTRAVRGGRTGQEPGRLSALSRELEVRRPRPTGNPRGARRGQETLTIILKC